jgi:xanthine dehydrogenase accessory factor
MIALIKGSGDLASGIALRLYRAGFAVVMTEIPFPLSVRRPVCFSQAVYNGRCEVEGVKAALVKDDKAIRETVSSLTGSCAGSGAEGGAESRAESGEKREIAVLVDPGAAIIKKLKPDVVIDAIMAKRNLGTSLKDAPVVIGVGPGFTAGIDCNAVIETQRGHTLGRVITEGSALPNTGIPGEIDGFSLERLLRCPADGIFEEVAAKSIGDLVKKGETVALVHNTQASSSGAADGKKLPVKAGVDGILRGLLPTGIRVRQGMKAGDVDPRCEREHCFTVSDKARAVGGGVLEAMLRFSDHKF